MIKRNPKKTDSSFRAASLWFIALLCASSHSISGEICITAESDPDGDGFGWEQQASCLVTDASSTAPTFFDPRTERQLLVQRIVWVEADFAEKSFDGCHGYLVDPDKESDECQSCNSEETYDYQHYADGNGRLVYSFGNSQKIEAEFTWGIDIYGIYFGPLPITGIAEITDNGIRQWQSGQPGEIGFYQQCTGAIPSTMIRTEVKTEKTPQTTMDIALAADGK